MGKGFEIPGTDESQIIAQEMIRQHAKNNTISDDLEGEEKSENEIYEELKKPFPKEALTIDNSRGFPLTSVKAQYIVERLNDVLGLTNWSFGGEFKETANGIIYFGSLVVSINGKQNRHFAPGFSGNKSNLGDSYKGAQTDSLSKCASRIGVANEVFKGNVKVESNTSESKDKTHKKSSNTSWKTKSSTKRDF